jgi:hypothetical protein
VELRIKLDATSGWGEVETIEVAYFKRRVVGSTAEEIGLEEAKQILADLQRLVLRTQMEESAFCARVSPDMPQDASSVRLPHADHPDAVRDGDGRGAADELLLVFQHDGVRRPVVFVACRFASRPLHARASPDMVRTVPWRTR